MNKKYILIATILILSGGFLTYNWNKGINKSISPSSTAPNESPSVTTSYTNEQPTPSANTINKNKFTQNEKYCEKEEDCAPTGCCNNYCHNIFNPIDDMCEKTCPSIAICKCINNQCVKTETKRVPEY